MLGIISGSGLYEIEGLSTIKSLEVDTQYGKPSGPFLECEYCGRVLYFLPRHGGNHSIPPHKVNYRANIQAMKNLGVERVISVSAVGGLNRDICPGSIVIGDQILDFTKGRTNTFFDGDDVVHVDFTYPYCEEMRMIIMDSAREKGMNVVDGGTYVAVEGPRLETASEIAFYRSIGVDIVGMTAMPEAVLAREAEICYAGIYVVTNYAAGIKEGRLTTNEVVQTMARSQDMVKQLLSEVLSPLDLERTCMCGDALKDARL
ncbi:MAG TPA: S-methyl-5'-thioadenosine phosphorylase [Nitrospirae bacterium]|nr:S-methyl-5'-thioadenosine phosphorylase [Nitrospirota bacterium]HDO21237.1 S-methyl-5'-thioadenosine phosphorylase [Nitrospirota bacterium]HDZ87550.1 S-methyl-5'-thioadenosine phosphorylase [Nitrospirota bacterium]